MTPDPPVSEITSKPHKVPKPEPGNQAPEYRNRTATGR